MDGMRPGRIDEPVGPATRRVRRAVTVATGGSCLFLALFAITAQVPSIRADSPWSEDPADAVLSFVALVLPVVIAVTWIRAIRWRGPGRSSPGPLRQQLRGATAAALLVAAGVLACLAALQLRGGERGVAGLPVAAEVGLIATTLAACLSLALVARTWAATRAWLTTPQPGAGPDLFDDLDALAGRAEDAPRLALPIRHLIGAGRRLGLRTARPVRAHPWRMCAVIAVVFGCALSLWHSAIEGVPSLPGALVIVPAYAALGAGLVVAAYASVGRYLELIRSEGA